MTALPPDVSAVPAPAPVRERSPLPDVLRGLAIVGILTVNMQEFSGYVEWRQSGLDRAAQVLIDVFANGRFISIFAMLFGWGAYGLLQRHGAVIFRRRHLLLLALGTAHHLLLWRGDIIGLYALLAWALLLLARPSVRGLLAVAAGLGGWWLLTGVLAAWAAGFGRAVEVEATRFSGLPPIRPGLDYAEVLARRAADFPGDYFAGALYNGPWVIALLALGAAAARAGLLTHPERFGWLFRRFVVLALPFGLLLGGLLAFLNTRTDLAAGLLAIPVRMSGGLLSALGYVGLLGLIAARGGLGRWGLFAAGGRLALTNYLTQTVVMTTIFYPYAGAQWGRWGAAPALALALAFGTLQLLFSAWWVRRFGSGPVERLLRRGVYGRASAQ
ncbi:DUF418 domain-containing protein [Deinococcus reticulitermitis]|uniref:DUF418 domain-containing protein n=1 Tax=Deinococcus reticulitermitis TaxID=856736 RepID=UPI000B88D59D|nr:DUF418 domain-containing protein [Deinococcus reticulitermitis]